MFERELASMGPRLLSRGEIPSTVGRVYPVRGFNGAAASQPRREDSHGDNPQCKRASMGPRLLSRGETQPSRQRLSVDTASMGPRLLSRGESSRAAILSTDQPRFNGAAASQPRREPHRVAFRQRWSRLQWGRGFSAAESSCRHHPDRFSSTASMGPRLLSRGEMACPSRCSLEHRLLQWGRGFSAAERCVQRRTT